MVDYLGMGQDPSSLHILTVLGEKQLYLNVELYGHFLLELGTSMMLE